MAYQYTIAISYLATESATYSACRPRGLHVCHDTLPFPVVVPCYFVLTIMTVSCCTLVI